MCYSVRTKSVSSNSSVPSRFVIFERCRSICKQNVSLLKSLFRLKLSQFGKWVRSKHVRRLSLLFPSSTYFNASGIFSYIRITEWNYANKTQLVSNQLNNVCAVPLTTQSVSRSNQMNQSIKQSINQSSKWQ